MLVAVLYIYIFSICIIFIFFLTCTFFLPVRSPPYRPLGATSHGGPGGDALSGPLVPLVSPWLFSLFQSWALSVGCVLRLVLVPCLQCTVYFEYRVSCLVAEYRIPHYRFFPVRSIVVFKVVYSGSYVLTVKYYQPKSDDYLDYSCEISVKDGGKTPVVMSIKFSGIYPFTAPMPPEEHVFRASSVVDLIGKVVRWFRKYGYEVV